MESENHSQALLLPQHHIGVKLWRLYGGIPISLVNPSCKESLVRMEVIEDWDPPQM